MSDLFNPLTAPASGVPQTESELRALVALAAVPGVGPSRVRALLAAFERPSRAMRALPSALSRVEGIGPQTAAAIRAWDDWEWVDDQFARAERVGACLVPYWADAYPALLRPLYDPPSFLWVRGRFTEADRLAVAVVGTRKASAYGKRVAEAFASDLVRQGVTVVSGLAYGIDVAAHRAALAAGGRTIAVLGSGVDRIYPSRHAGLVREITEADRGAVVSEFPMGAAPDAPNFPRRNRVVAGLAQATLVAEARATGGALLTAYLALEQNRGVFAAPAPLFSEHEGTNRLIQKGGAALVTSADEILEEIAPQLAEAEPAPADHPPPVLSGVEAQLYEALSTEPVHLDVLCDRAGVDASTALVYLLTLEFKGLVRQMAGKQFFRA